jgi:ABC-type Na+ transport system ATPase subunit NatA
MSLEIDGLTKRYGATLALDAIRFSVPRGQIFGFLGANGAGKTTTMRICLGIIPADAGQVRWDGTPVLQLSLQVGTIILVGLVAVRIYARASSCTGCDRACGTSSPRQGDALIGRRALAFRSRSGPGSVPG